MNDNSVLRDECFPRTVFVVARMKKCDGRRWMSDQIADFLQAHIDKLRAHEIPGADYTHYMPETGNIVETHVEFGEQDGLEKYLLVCRDLGRPAGWSGSKYGDREMRDKIKRIAWDDMAEIREEHIKAYDYSLLDCLTDKRAKAEREGAAVRRQARIVNRRLNTCRQKERQWRAAA